MVINVGEKGEEADRMRYVGLLTPSRYYVLLFTTSHMRTTATLVDTFLPILASKTGGRTPCHTRPMTMAPRSYPYRLRFALLGFDYTQPTAELW